MFADWGELLKAPAPAGFSSIAEVGGPVSAAEVRAMLMSGGSWACHTDTNTETQTHRHTHTHTHRERERERERETWPREFEF